MSENAATGIGSGTAPTVCRRPFGASAAIIASQSSVALTVLIKRSKRPASFLIAAESLVEATWVAPNPFASLNFLSLDVNAVTSHPYAAANFTAICPSPPMPITPTRSVGLAYLTSGAKTVIPPHMSGPDSAGSSFSGSGTVQAQCARTWVANPPRGPMMVGCTCGQRGWVPERHWRHCILLPEFQPTPTRCPILSRLAFGPTAVTRPTISWPRTAGYCEMPQSLFKTDRSEWHTPQCSTATSMSSAPSEPRSIV